MDIYKSYRHHADGIFSIPQPLFCGLSFAVNVISSNFGGLTVVVPSLVPERIFGLGISTICVLLLFSQLLLPKLPLPEILLPPLPSRWPPPPMQSTAATVAITVHLSAAFITDQLPAVAPSMAILVAVAAFSVKLFVCSGPIGQHDICRFVLVSQSCHEGLVATDHLDAQVMESSGGIGFRCLKL